MINVICLHMIVLQVSVMLEALQFSEVSIRTGNSNWIKCSAIQGVREHLHILIGNLVSNVNIGMFRFRYLLHAAQKFPFESRLNRKSIGSISIHIGTSSGEQNISTRGIYTISFIFVVYSRICSRSTCVPG